MPFFVSLLAVLGIAFVGVEAACAQVICAARLDSNADGSLDRDAAAAPALDNALLHTYFHRMYGRRFSVERRRAAVLDFTAAALARLRQRGARFEDDLRDLPVGTDFVVSPNWNGDPLNDWAARMADQYNAWVLFNGAFVAEERLAGRAAVDPIDPSVQFLYVSPNALSLGVPTLVERHEEDHLFTHQTSENGDESLFHGFLALKDGSNLTDLAYPTPGYANMRWDEAYAWTRDAGDAASDPSFGEEERRTLLHESRQTRQRNIRLASAAQSGLRLLQTVSPQWTLGWATTGQYRFNVPTIILELRHEYLGIELPGAEGRRHLGRYLALGAGPHERAKIQLIGAALRHPSMRHASAGLRDQLAEWVRDGDLAQLQKLVTVRVEGPTHRRGREATVVVQLPGQREVWVTAPTDVTDRYLQAHDRDFAEREHFFEQVHPLLVARLEALGHTLSDASAALAQVVDFVRADQMPAARARALDAAEIVTKAFAWPPGSRAPPPPRTH